MVFYVMSVCAVGTYGIAYTVNNSSSLLYFVILLIEFILGLANMSSIQLWISVVFKSQSTINENSIRIPNGVLVY
jgi:hypothetical protein